MSAVSIIVRAEIRAWRNRLLGNSGRAVGLAILLALGGLVVGGSLFGVAFAVGSFLPSAREAVLAGAFTALAVMMLVVGFPSVIGSYFAGRDLMALVLAPVSIRDIFLARSLFAMSANALVAALFLVFVAGLGAGSQASPLYYLLALVLVVVQVLSVTALQVLVMAGVLRVVPARIAREVAVAVAGVGGAALYAAWNLTLRQSFATLRRRPDLSQLTATLHRIDWLPSAWPGHALGAVIDGDLGATLLWTGLALLLAALLSAGAALLYESTLLSGLGILGGVGMARRRQVAVRAGVEREGRGSPGMAIARKDWIVYRRDVRRLTRLLPALMFVFVYGFVLFRPPRGIDALWSGAFAITFVCFFLSIVLAVTAIPSERRGFQLLRLAPVTPWEVLRAKLLFTLAPVLVISAAVAVVTSIVSGGGVGTTVALVALGIWVSAGCVGISVAAGAIDPHFDSADERRAVGVLGTVTAMGASVAFALLSIGAFGLLVLASQLAGGASAFGGLLPASPATAVVVAGIGLALAGGGAGLVAVLLNSGASSLGKFEAGITAT